MTDFFGNNVDKDKLLEILQKGGHVLYFRHADPAETSGDPGLSIEGKKKAESLKLLFQEKKLFLIHQFGQVQLDGLKKLQKLLLKV
ncbi:hypothetical protein GXP75_03530 [Bacillus sp. HU-1818]|uniref:hypothetical protein n=1 Tax=Bacillus sp. HU-1818 TaxID=2704469 RepID=UPI001F5DB042|nr:hypothetical protein [Bacillus sp. HU-1818]MCI3194765.1 hypothetical protein [Bacillus sp. HU-1818]